MENTSQEKSDLNRRKAKLMEIRLSAYGDNAVAVGATILARRKGNV